jgi:peptide/nickel transport system ATP-binding protein
MNDLQRENGTAIIFITHDLGVIDEMADDVVVMYCGQVVEQTSAKVIFTDCPVSHPYTEGLMHSIPRMDNVGKKLEPIPGAVPHPLALPKGCKFAPRCKYATQKCLDEEPALLEVVPGQKIRCHYPEKEVRCSEEHKHALVDQES